jgi:hypothetical protein
LLNRLLFVVEFIDVFFNFLHDFVVETFPVAKEKQDLKQDKEWSSQQSLKSI